MRSAVTTRRRVGRPRLVPETDGRVSPRDQILDSAARLFTEHGFAATSTRQIADAVGIRQASLYYHFAGKDEILAELLARTVRPTLDQIDKLDKIAAESGWAAALYALVMVDTKTLADVPHNTGRLPSCPDVFSLDLFAPYKATLRDLVAAYERFGRQIAGLPVNGLLLEHLVEYVVTARANGDDADDIDRHAIATSVLRHCGADNDEIVLASAVAWAELVD